MDTSLSFTDELSKFDYSFDNSLIADSPASPRESAKLMIYDRKQNKVVLDTYENIIQYLPPTAVLVFNRTKVIPAKFTLTKKTGGAIGALFLEQKKDCIRVIASGSFQKGDTLRWITGHSFTVIHRMDKEALLKPSFPISDFMRLLLKYGETPLPPYIKKSPLTEAQKRQEYQTVFANKEGSVAAPTSGMHFSEELIKKIEQSGRSVAYITLHVGLGTFAPLTEEQWKTKQLHLEYFDIDEQTAVLLNLAKSQGRPIIAVGTTTVRTLESSVREGNGLIGFGQGSTRLFISDKSDIRFVDSLITNFHVPKSSLMMLVAAFTGREKLLELYQQAMNARMRLFSFGDGMMIL